MDDPIVIERHLDGPPDAVWEAWTDPGRLAQWLCEAARVDAEPGGRYELYWEPDRPERNSTIGCRLTAVEPGRELAFDWRGPVQFHDLMNSEPFPTHVRVRLAPEGSGCRVRLEHAGWGDGERWAAARAWQAQAWTGAVERLAVQLGPGGGLAAAAAALSPAEVAAWRERFPILGRCTYLINNSLGAMPGSVPGSLAEFTDAWATEGVEAWNRWFPEVRRVADLLGSLLGAPAGSVVVHQNVATLAAMVLSALEPMPARRRVVVTDLEWPGHRHLLAGYERRGLLDVEVVPTDGVHVDLEALLAAIDERTLLVPVSHVVFRSGCVTGVEAVCARAREVGAVSIVDGYHALGHLPVDVERIGCDLYTGGSVKWLCGGPGVGYLYVRPDSGIEPVDVGWLGHAQPFDFDPGWEPAPGAMGWLGGTPSVPALYAAREGYRIVSEVGPERIRATSLPLTARLVEGALERGHEVRTPLDPAARGGAVTIDVGERSEAVARRLIAAGIVVDHRKGSGIRVGPHFFNTLEECDALLEALDP